MMLCIIVCMIDLDLVSVSGSFRILDSVSSISGTSLIPPCPRDNCWCDVVRMNGVYVYSCVRSTDIVCM